MANFNTHTIAGLIVGAIFWVISKDMSMLIIGAIYSMIPDLDINNSTSFKWYAVLTGCYAIYTIVFMPFDTTTVFDVTFPKRYLAVPPLLGLVLLQFINHREFLHSIAAGFAFSIPVFFYAGWVGVVCAVFGYSSHLLLDNEFFDGIFT